LASTKPVTGSSSNGIPFRESGVGKERLVIFQGLSFQHKPPSGMMDGMYGFLKNDFLIRSVLPKPSLPDNYTMRDLSNDFAEMIRKDIASPVNILGVSTGGSIALHFAADHPDLVRRLVIHSSAHSLSQTAKAFQRLVSQHAQNGSWWKASALLASFIFPKKGVKKYLTRPLVWLAATLMSMDKPEDAHDLTIMVEAEEKHAFKDRLSEIKAPTLVIAGTSDPFYTPQLFRETFEGIPGAKLVLYEGMGHVASGKPFQREVLQFFRN
jgi:pimeloyl-ACP methyl ester carboxylesterase